MTSKDSETAQAIYDTFTSSNVADSNGEAANLVDTTAGIASQLLRIACRLREQNQLLALNAFVAMEAAGVVIDGIRAGEGSDAAWVSYRMSHEILRAAMSYIGFTENDGNQTFEEFTDIIMAFTPTLDR